MAGHTAKPRQHDPGHLQTIVFVLLSHDSDAHRHSGNTPFSWHAISCSVAM
jgi:hypothetical protein